VVIRTRAASVNPIDWKIRKGSFRMLMPAKFPLILGYDVAGEVDSVGPEVTRFQPGDPVFGGVDVVKQGGSYAELVLAREAALAPMPGALSFEEAASLPTSGQTCLQALRDKGELVSGERVLVNGASGGVGHLAVQIAFALGAKVTGVTSGRNLDFVRGLGAHEVIDYEEEDFVSRDETWDVIFDVVANSNYRECEPVLSEKGGIYVTTGFYPRLPIEMAMTALGGLFGQSQRARNIVVKHRAEDLVFLERLANQGRLRPEVQEVFPLDRIAQAHDLSETGRVRGKIAVRI
ncbi:MAG TPA: NAD(P)-dependent alcohol dehydrogenase, partial [Thermoanaerobaculia bacterium]|nr:NAD(P)-dependent alcohol dehydrogenase [Thermoanaerobaculia bacterium]